MSVEDNPEDYWNEVLETFDGMPVSDIRNVLDDKATWRGKMPGLDGTELELEVDHVVHDYEESSTQRIYNLRLEKEVEEQEGGEADKVIDEIYLRIAENIDEDTSRSPADLEFYDSSEEAKQDAGMDLPDSPDVYIPDPDTSAQKDRSPI